MHDVPRQLTVEELAELFEGRTRLVEKLAEQEDPLGAARDVIGQLKERDKLEALNAHPAIGAKRLSPRSSAVRASTIRSGTSPAPRPGATTC